MHLLHLPRGPFKWLVLGWSLHRWMVDGPDGRQACVFKPPRPVPVQSIGSLVSWSGPGFGLGVCGAEVNPSGGEKQSLSDTMFTIRSGTAQLLSSQKDCDYCDRFIRWSTWRWPIECRGRRTYDVYGHTHIPVRSLPWPTVQKISACRPDNGDRDRDATGRKPECHNGRNTTPSGPLDGLE